MKYLLFDDDCYICNNFVRLVDKHYTLPHLYFVPLNSVKGIELKGQYNIDSSIDSVIFIDEIGYFIKSAAAIKIMTEMGMPYSIIAFVSKVFPKIFRDYVYDFIARNRKKWFDNDNCPLPSETMKKRILTS